MEKQNNLPILRFSKFKDTWLSERLHESVDAKSSKYNPQKGNTAIKCIELEHISSETGELLGYIDGQHSGSIKNVFQKGDVLFGKLRPYLRKYLLAPFDGVCSSEIWVLKSKNGLNSFLYYIVQSDRFIDLTAISSGSKMPRADWNVVSNGLFYIPSLPEQQKIASFLTAVDDKIQQLTKKKALWELYKKAVMQQLFSQKLRFKDEQGSAFPDWEMRQLKDVLIERKTRNVDTKFTEVFSVAKHKGVINQIEHLGRSYASADISNYKVVNPDDIIYTKSPTSDFPYGIIKQNKTQRYGVVSVLYAVLRPINKYIGFMIDSYFLSGVNTYNYLNPLVQKGAKNTMNIGNTDFLNGAYLSLPSSEMEQIKIATFISAIDEKIERVNQQIEQTQQFKKGLLQQMFV